MRQHNSQIHSAQRKASLIPFNRAELCRQIRTKKGGCAIQGLAKEKESARERETQREIERDGDSSVWGCVCFRGILTCIQSSFSSAVL